jgi:hypothetical protein
VVTVILFHHGYGMEGASGDLIDDYFLVGGSNGTRSYAIRSPNSGVNLDQELLSG